MKTDTIYKATTYDRDSIVANKLIGGVNYSETMFIKARPQFANAGYHLLAFDNKEDAIHFAVGWNWTGYLWLAEGREQISFLPPMLDKYGIANLAEGASKTWLQYYKANSEWPNGTVMYKEIRLISVLRCLDPYDDSWKA